MTRYFFGASQEQFPPEALLHHAVAAERAGFDGISASDHLQPWWEPGESGHTWPWLGAAGRRPRSSRRHRRHADRRPLPPRADRPGVDDARAMFPGRPFLGIGSGEALNEVPVATTGRARRPDRPPGRGARLHPPPVGRRDDHRGGALLPRGLQAAHAGRPPAADLGLRLRPAGRRGGGPLGRRAVDAARPRVDARGHRRLSRGAPEAGREGDGEIVFQALVSGRATTRRARAGAQVEGRPAARTTSRDDWHRPRGDVRARRARVSDEEFLENRSSPPTPRPRERLRELEGLGDDRVALQNNSAPTPCGRSRSSAAGPAGLRRRRCSGHGRGRRRRGPRLDLAALHRVQRRVLWLARDRAPRQPRAAEPRRA